MDAAFYLLYFFFGLTGSLFFALLEIQIEGRHGWAEKLPTWKRYIKWLMIIPGFNGMVTGYHTYLWSLLIIMSHTIFIYLPWNFKTELLVLSFFTFLIIVEDFLWFALNPNYGIGKLNKQNVKWHTAWVGRVPLAYIVYPLVWVILFGWGIL